MNLKIVFLLLFLPSIIFSNEITTDNTESDDEIGFPLTAYKPVYFITGYPNTKVQISFKYQLFDNLDLYFGYSQLAFWELLTKKSSPFGDINFNPELFYNWDISKHKRCLLYLTLLYPKA